VPTAIGAQTEGPREHGEQVAEQEPEHDVGGARPKLTSSAPITNSVAATCSPAKRPAKYEPGCSLSGRHRSPLELVEAVEPPDHVSRGFRGAHPFTSGVGAV